MSAKKPLRKTNPASLPTISPFPAELLATDEWPALRAALQERPEKCVRLRHPFARGIALPSDLPFETGEVPWYALGRLAVGTHQPGRYLAHAASEYFVQDAGSMLALQALAPQPNEWIADVCAAPGAKATALLEVVGSGDGFLLANEPIAGRVAALTSTLARVGCTRYAVSQADVETLAEPLAQQFDAVLVDAPCTGQTMVGRGKHTAIGAFQADAIRHASLRQERILRAAADLVCPGGRLVYSTCTLNVEENETLIASFLASHPEWFVVPVEPLQPWVSPLAPGGYRLWPHRHDCAGAYAIRLQNGSGSNCESPRTVTHLEQTSVPEIIGSCGELVGCVAWNSGKQWFTWPEAVPSWLPRIRAMGAEIAYQPGKSWQPSHALALRRDESFRPIKMIELSDGEARAFLQGQTLSIVDQGWAVVTWRGNPLGWIHSNSLRANNGLPSSARIPFAPMIQ